MSEESAKSSSGQRTVLVDGLMFPESPRWHDNRLWFVDMVGCRVLNVGLDGQVAVAGQFDDIVSGLGFLPDGTPIVVLAFRRQIVRVPDGSVHADLSTYDAWYLNDMVVSRDGHAYVDVIQRGDGLHTNADAGDGIGVIDPDGSWRIGATGGVVRPNGLAITEDGRDLIVGMRTIHKLVAYGIDDSGSLTEPREYADSGSEWIDGICLDADGAVWIASPHTGNFTRIMADSTVDRQISLGDRWAVACALGGPDRRTLFMITADPPENPHWGVDTNLTEARGFVETTVVDVPGVGIP